MEEIFIITWYSYSVLKGEIKTPFTSKINNSEAPSNIPFIIDIYPLESDICH
jgi:hypothetical protein